jgi:hypothetical protein
MAFVADTLLNNCVTDVSPFQLDIWGYCPFWITLKPTLKYSGV